MCGQVVHVNPCTMPRGTLIHVGSRSKRDHTVAHSRKTERMLRGQLWMVRRHLILIRGCLARHFPPGIGER